MSERPRVAYRSPLEALSTPPAQDEAYRGTLRDVLHDLSLPTRTRAAYHPPRIVRAVINYNIRNRAAAQPDVQLALTQEAIGAALAMYAQPQGIRRIAKALTHTLQSIDENVLNADATQLPDPIAAYSQAPRDSLLAASLLARKLNGQPMTFVALGHSGIIPGMDIFHFYDQLTEAPSFFYVVRFSRRKLHDKMPMLTDAERALVLRHATEKTLVLFDEHCTTGETLDTAASYFSKHSSARIITLTNRLGSKFGVSLHEHRQGTRPSSPVPQLQI